MLFLVVACAAAVVVLVAVSALTLSTGAVSFGESLCHELRAHDALIVIDDVAFYVYVPQRSGYSGSEGGMCKDVTNNSIHAMVCCWRMKSASEMCNFPAELVGALREASLLVSQLNAEGYHYLMPGPLYCNRTAIYVPVIKEWGRSYLDRLITELENTASKYGVKVVLYILYYSSDYVDEVERMVGESIESALSRLGLSSEDWVWFYDFVTGRPLIVVNLSVKTPTDERVYKVIMTLSKITEFTENVKEIEVMLIQYYTHAQTPPQQNTSTNP